MASVENLNYFTSDTEIRENEENTTDTEDDSGIAEEADAVIHLKWPKSDTKQIHGQASIELYNYWQTPELSRI
ncbi:hypothetical protein DMENIID0001_110490 [Sergentomyia squamirostris]